MHADTGLHYDFPQTVCLSFHTFSMWTRILCPTFSFSDGVFQLLFSASHPLVGRLLSIASPDSGQTPGLSVTAESSVRTLHPCAHPLRPSQSPGQNWALDKIKLWQLKDVSHKVSSLSQWVHVFQNGSLKPEWKTLEAEMDIWPELSRTEHTMRLHSTFPNTKNLQVGRWLFQWGSWGECGREDSL